MNYEQMKNDYTELAKRKNALMREMEELRAAMSKIESDKADAAFREIQDRIALINSLGYVLDVKVWDNECGDYNWEENLPSTAIRLRRKDTIIV